MIVDTLENIEKYVALSGEFAWVCLALKLVSPREVYSVIWRREE